MTTIAYRDGILAADTLGTYGNGQVDGYCTKIVKRGPFLAAAIGLWAPALRFLDWFRAGCQGEPPNMGEKDDNGTGLVFLPDGQLITFRPVGWTRITPPGFYSNGSGCEYAMGAMSMGASAYQAVRIAMEHDRGTGGEIDTLSHLS